MSIVVGLAVWECMLPGCASLKEKRSVIKSLKDRMHNQFNVSASETGHQNSPQRAEIAACVVSGSQAQANAVLDSLDRFVETESRLRIIDSYTTYY